MTPIQSQHRLYVELPSLKRLQLLAGSADQIMRLCSLAGLIEAAAAVVATGVAVGVGVGVRWGLGDFSEPCPGTQLRSVTASVIPVESARLLPVAGVSIPLSLLFL